MGSHLRKAVRIILCFHRSIHSCLGLSMPKAGTKQRSPCAEKIGRFTGVQTRGIVCEVII